ncbi:MAG: helix-turn-helix domain-containing protein [Pseudomonadota bacterium]
MNQRLGRQSKEGSPQERMLAAGRKLFFERGFQNVSTDMIAKEASVSKGSLYKYYPNMAGLLKEVTRAEASHFQAAEPEQVPTPDWTCFIKVESVF